jgi:preprotein translocase subunit SecF
MIDILGKRYYFFALSLLVILPGLILLVINGLPLAIDFTGGSLLEVRFDETELPPSEPVYAVYEELGVTDVQVLTTDQNSLVIRSNFLDDETRAQVETALEERFNTSVTMLRFESVGPTVGREVAQRALIAVAVAAAIVVLYMTLAFRKVPNSLRYGLCAIAAMVHDVAVVLSLMGIGAYFFDWQIDSLFLTALLTVIGFSVQDKIVVFDRVRENSQTLRGLNFETLVNHSIIQTLQRSINTQLMTVEFMLLALALFGGVTLRQFALVLLVGLFSGTYSSIFIAAPILVLWEKREWKRWFRRGVSEAQSV